MCVMDVGVTVTNLRVVCKTITCVSAFTEIAIILFFLEIVEAGAGLDTLRCRLPYVKDAIVGTCHRTIDGQEHKIIWLAGPERDTIFHLRVTACREQGSHCRQERLAWVPGSFTVAGDFVLQLIRLESLGSELQQSYMTTFILWLINTPCALTGSNL